MKISRHSECKKPDPKPVIRPLTSSTCCKNNEKFLKKKEIELRYSKINLNNNSRTTRKLSAICKTLEKKYETPAKKNTNFSDTRSDIDSSVYEEPKDSIASSKNLQKKEEMSEGNFSELVEKEDLKSQLEEQLHINREAKTFLTKETYKYKSLAKRLDDYVESNKNQFDDESYMIQSTSDEHELILKSANNGDCSSTHENKSHRSLTNSKSQLEGSNQADDVSNEKNRNFESSYNHVLNKVDEIIKLNQMLQTQLKIQRKREASSERRVDDKISECNASEEDKESSCTIHLQGPSACADERNHPNIIIFNPTTNQVGKQNFSRSRNDGPNNLGDIYTKISETFAHKGFSNGKFSRNAQISRTFHQYPLEYGQSIQESDISCTTWEEDEDVTSCSICSTDFWLFQRKHHCRVCGKIFCGSCSRYYVNISGKKRRACKHCKESYDLSHPSKF
ncbi:unnamed protein product [Moneuplotes crassus]|uniref:FYVE-type domain-containing protein n=1 Tax=Euplotes crassus TaxID=5936 RepID=A0AAD1UGT0_EUPCR|nr:unnamed protein product [Moneuplotes crassus]